MGLEMYILARCVNRIAQDVHMRHKKIRGEG